MSRRRNLIILLCVLVVLAVAAFAVTRMNLDTQVEEVVENTVFSLDDTSVTELSWTWEDETLTFLQDEKTGWYYADDASFPLNDAYLEAMVSVLTDVTAIRTIETPEDFSEYGLDEPECRIFVATADGGETTLIFGDESGLGEGRYLSLEDGNVYVADDILDSFSYGLYDLVAMEEIPAMTELTGFSVEAQVRSLELVRLEESGLAYTDSLCWFTPEKGDYIALDTDRAEDFISLVSGLSWQNCVDYHAEDLSVYGLDLPTVTATVTYVGDDEEDTFTVEIGDYASDDDCYARIAGSNMVYLIDASVCDALLYTAVSDLLPTDILDLDWDTVEELDISLDGLVYTVTREQSETEDEDGEVTEETIWTWNGEEIALESVLDSLNDLVSTGSGENLEPERDALVGFTFRRNTENFSVITLTFYAYDSSSCLVEFDGETRLFAARSAVNDLVTDLAELLEG